MPDPVVKMTFDATKAGFFDREAVINALGKAELKILKKFGADVRRVAQNSLVYTDGKSAPGQPPHAHRSRTVTKTSKKTGKTRTRSLSFLREYLYFSYDAKSKSVVVGPSRLDSTIDPEALPALEYGGPSTILDHGKRLSVNIHPHPFMGPAAEAERPAMMASWKDSIR